MAGVNTGLSEVVAAAASIEDPASTPTTPAITLQSVFSNAVVQPPIGESSTGLIQEALRKLSSLWDTQQAEIDNVTEDHWRNPEFPLARLKKIMRMDEDVKMISGEVPILLSKVIEIFVTELTLRAWMQTAESKRRTVQRSDIAMAIARNDMFDFLIDIVPREEIQGKSRNSLGNSTSTSNRQAESSSDDSNPLLQPEVLQSYLQMLYQQSDTEGGEGGDNASNLMATSTLLQQQVHLLQQLIQLQQQMQRQDQEEQEQQQSEEEDQLQHLQLQQQPQVMQASSDVLQQQSSAELGRVLEGVKEVAGTIGLQSLSSLGFNPSSHGTQQD